MEKEIVVKKAAEIIRRRLPAGYKVLLFGSWARGDALETSDIDLGILGKEKVPWSAMVKIVEEVENLPTLRPVDIVDLIVKDRGFQQEALQYGKLIS